jgi:uncharacterized protein (TIGR03086 family)
MTHIDLTPAAQRMAELISAIPGDGLGAPTPCPRYTLGDLVEHVGGLAQAFAAAARKDVGGLTSHAPSGDASRLAPDWRIRIPQDLLAMADAWRDPEAWTGMTEAGGVALPGDIAGVVALDELVVHGWDVARASGQPYACDEPALRVVQAFVARFDQREGVFGPVVDVAPGAPLLDQVIGLTGRDPGWPHRS